MLLNFITGYVLYIFLNTLYRGWFGGHMVYSIVRGEFRKNKKKITKNFLESTILCILFSIGLCDSALLMLICLVAVTFSTRIFLRFLYSFVIRSASVTIFYFILKSTLTFYFSDTHAQMLTLIVILTISAVLSVLKLGLMLSGGAFSFFSSNKIDRIITISSIIIFCLLTLKQDRNILIVESFLYVIFFITLYVENKQHRKILKELKLLDP